MKVLKTSSRYGLTATIERYGADASVLKG